MFAQNSDNALKDYDMITFGLLFKITMLLLSNAKEEHEFAGIC